MSATNDRHEASLDVDTLARLAADAVVRTGGSRNDIASAIAKVLVKHGGRRPATSTETVPEELRDLTFAVQHNPNCPKPWLVRLPGDGVLDLLPYDLPVDQGRTNDVLGFGQTFASAAEMARDLARERRETRR